MHVPDYCLSEPPPFDALGGIPDAYLDHKTNTFVPYPHAKSRLAASAASVPAPVAEQPARPPRPAAPATPVRRPKYSPTYVPGEVGSPGPASQGPPQPEPVVNPPLTLDTLADEVWAARSAAAGD